MHRYPDNGACTVTRGAPLSGVIGYNKKSISEFELNDSFDTLVHINPDPDTNPVLPQRLIEKVFNQDNSN